MAGTETRELSTDLIQDLPTFLRKFEQRAEGVMWLLGAGASRASNIKTAGDMIWDFKSRLYRSAKQIPASAVSNLSDPRTQEVLQKFCDDSGKFPELWAETEYAEYFEATYPEAQDRRRYIDGMIKGAKPSYGHMALAHLMKRDRTRIIWTTNFDRVVEDAVAQVWGTTTELTVGALGEPERISTAYAQQSWPLYAKLHGDFQSETLKNTNDELATQDARMRDILLDTCRNQGLAVSGYSGRDASIMSVLREAINDGKGFPNGLFWFVRETDHLYQGLIDLITDAKNAGVDACFVKAESFDELFSDIIRYLPETEDLTIKLDDKAKIAPRKINLTNMSASVPFVRTNALPITDFPKTVRLVDCEIGGAKEIRELMEGKESSLIASRIKKGVLAFGDDGEIRRVFGDNDLRSLDTHSIIEERLAFESGERSLLRDALLRALSVHSGFELHRARHRYFFRADRGQPKFGLKALQTAAQRLSGTTSGGVPWTEACQLRLDYRMSRLWLLLSPVVLVDFDDKTSEDAKAQAKELQRERRVRRYNQQSNAILDGWIQAIFGTTRDPVTLGIEGGTGIGARFEILPVTGFSGVQS